MRLATIEGVAALGMEDRIGSIAEGKEADIVLLSKKKLALSPVIQAANVDTLASLIIYSTNEKAIETVFAGGRPVVQNGELAAPLNQADLVADLTAIANDVMSRQARGMRWQETVDIADFPVGEPSFRYRSVRKNFGIDLKIINSGDTERTLLLALSGAAEGCLIAPMLSPETLRRFPWTHRKSISEKEISVLPGESIGIDKQEAVIPILSAHPVKPGHTKEPMSNCCCWSGNTERG